MDSGESKAIIEALRSGLASIQHAIQDQISAIRDASETGNKERGEIPRVISCGIRSAENEATYEHAQRDKEYRQQRKIMLVTLGAFVAAAAYAGIAAYQLSEVKNQTMLSEHALTEAQNALNTSQSQFDRTMDKAVIQTSAQLKSAKAAESAADTARETLVASQRALVSFVGQSTGEVVLQDGKITGVALSLPWINSGNTPTRRAQSVVNWVVTPPIGMEDTFDFSDRGKVQPRQFAIAPKGTANGTETIPVPYLELTKSQNLRLYVWGWIKYHDIFPNTPTYLSEFCDEIVSIQSSNDDMTNPTTTFKWEMALCTVPHNCSDEECKDYKEKTNGK